MADPILLDGKALSKRLNKGLKYTAQELPRPPGLAVVLVGADPASQVYVRAKGRVAERIGFAHQQLDWPASATQEELEALIDALNADDAVDGILVQLPLPAHLDARAITERILPEKDVDGFHPMNTGLLSQGRRNLVPCTPLGVMVMLEDAGISLSGLDAVVVGRSNIVGRPMAMLLEQAGCTVTVCHSRTRDLSAHLSRADLVVAAIGRPEMIRAESLKPGCIVVDVGMNRLDDGRLTGDVHFEGAAEVASAITPVPGGVGPMTIAMLMRNTWLASRRRQGLPEE